MPCLASSRSTDLPDGPLCEPCSESPAPPVDSVLGGVIRPPASEAEDPDLVAKREEELSPAELLEKRRLVLEAQTVRHKMTHLP